MSSDTRSPWETAIDNLTGPWDLAVISAGVAAAAVAAALGPWSVEDLLPVGAFGGMAILKGVQALQARRALRRRAEGIGAEHSGIESLPGDRAQFLDKELSLWEKHITTNAEFSQVLDQLVTDIRDSLWAKVVSLDNLLKEMETKKKADGRAASRTASALPGAVRWSRQ